MRRTPAELRAAKPKSAHVRDSEKRLSPGALLREIGAIPTLTIYLASAPGAGKTRRLIEDALLSQRAGRRVAIGWLETKNRSDLDVLAAPLPRIPPRSVQIGSAEFWDFDYEAALEMHPQLLVLDELAHTNLAGGAHAKRWEDALALRAAGISVVGALNIQHVETVAGVAERIIGFPVREIVPLSFLKAADQVVALDVAPEQLEARLRSGAIVRPQDVQRALAGAFRPQNLHLLREMMLHTVDDLTEATVTPSKTSAALALVTPDVDAGTFLRRVAPLAEALNLELNVASQSNRDDDLAAIAAEYEAAVTSLPRFDWGRPKLYDVKATLVAVPRGALAAKLAANPATRDLFVVDPASSDSENALTRVADFGPLAQAAGDVLRIGYGRMTIYLGAAAGTGKTYAMLDRAHQLQAAGVDVVAAFIETHGRAETAKLMEGLEVLPRKRLRTNGIVYSELDVEALLARKPRVALIDELAHTNAPGSEHEKRYDDVLAVLRAGISVMTTVNVQHFEGLSDAVYRLTGQRVRETLPDAVLERADEIIFVDTTPEALRERLRSGKIYPAERIERALNNFFRAENLAALRELAIREAVRAGSKTVHQPVFARLLLGVKARERDIALIERCRRLAGRIDADFEVVHVSRSASSGAEERTIEALQAAASEAGARWRHIVSDDAARSLVREAGQEGATLAVEGARSISWIRGGKSFARRLLDAGARQLLIFAAEPAASGRVPD